MEAAAQIDRVELSGRALLATNFPLYAKECLKIRPKTGGTTPFVLNETQKYVHDKIEEQRAKIGKVRAIILKARQPGISTYVEGRFYWRVTHGEGLYAFILTHEDPATQNLFDMANRFHEHCPDEVRPETGSANAKELNFRELDSGYKVATAGTKGVGRSGTYQLFHGSEVAHWPNDREHAMGAMQAVPDVEGTEVILESTANGIGNYFHQQWQAAERGESEFVAIFIPWFWSKEYRKEVSPGFRFTEEEADYASQYGLSPEQIAWRRQKITDFGGDEWRFKQEYPATAAEAFQTSGADSYIPALLVAKARKNKVDPSGPLLIGVDPARFGTDGTAFIRRQGRKAFKLELFHKLDTMAIVGLVAKTIREEKPRKVFLDVGGLGAGVYDRLVELGYGEIVVAVNGGSKPFSPPREDEGGYLNRRAEMWGLMKQWLGEAAGVEIPDSDVLQGDLTGPFYSYDSHSRLKLESKDDMKKRGVASPDAADALALTFAEPVIESARWSRPLNYSVANAAFADNVAAIARLKQREMKII